MKIVLSLADAADAMVEYAVENGNPRNPKHP